MKPFSKVRFRIIMPSLFCSTFPKSMDYLKSCISIPGSGGHNQKNMVLILCIYFSFRSFAPFMFHIFLTFFDFMEYQNSGCYHKIVKHIVGVAFFNQLPRSRATEVSKENSFLSQQAAGNITQEIPLYAQDPCLVGRQEFG